MCRFLFLSSISNFATIFFNRIFFRFFVFLVFEFGSFSFACNIEPLHFWWVGAICLLLNHLFLSFVYYFFPFSQPIFFGFLTPPKIGWLAPHNIFAFLCFTVCVFLISIENDLLTSNQKRKTDNTTRRLCYEPLLVFLSFWISKKEVVRARPTFSYWSLNKCLSLFLCLLLRLAIVHIRILYYIAHRADCLPILLIKSRLDSIFQLQTDGENFVPNWAAFQQATRQSFRKCWSEWGKEKNGNRHRFDRLAVLSSFLLFPKRKSPALLISIIRSIFPPTPWTV